MATLGVAYCVGCWLLTAWGTVVTYGYEHPWPWLAAVVLEAPMSVLLAGLYGALLWVQPAEGLGTVMGFVLVIGLVVSAPLKLLVLRRVWRRRTNS